MLYFKNTLNTDKFSSCVVKFNKSLTFFPVKKKQYANTKKNFHFHRETWVKTNTSLKKFLNNHFFVNTILEKV